jgi:aerobic-type carbon monoxide dehydrogenase small subunit (CoxS/CutS family)
MPTRFTLNGREVSVDADPATPLLWILRDTLGLTGTKYGCGVAQCGACTVHLDGVATRACATPLDAVAGQRVTTIEGLSPDGASHPVQRAWIELDVPQCGYCQCGQMMTAAAFLAETPRPSREAIREAMAGNLCRCGTYHRIEAAVARAAELSA